MAERVGLPSEPRENPQKTRILRWMFVSVNGMCFGLGMLVMTIFAEWAGGHGIFWSIMLALWQSFGVVVMGLTVMVRIKSASE